jgi:LysM repeat protein
MGQVPYHLLLSFYWRHLYLKQFSHAIKHPIVQILGTALVCLALIGLPWAFHAYPFQQGPTGVHAAAPTETPTVEGAEFTATPEADLPYYTTSQSTDPGIPRLADVHTTIPEQPAFDMTEYTVKEGDTIFEIATKFKLKPSTILWGNLTRLADNPEMIYPGQKLNILPVDGVLYEWHEGDGLNGVAKGLNVTPDDIINFPGNHLDPKAIGDLAGTATSSPGARRPSRASTPARRGCMARGPARRPRMARLAPEPSSSRP